MLINRVLAIICLALVILIIIRLSKKKYLKNYYVNNQETDKLINSVESKNKNRSLVFTPTNELTAKYINKYIISRSKGVKSFICEYKNAYKSICFYISIYDKVGKLINIYQVKDLRKEMHSKVINLPLRCALVNVTVGTVENEVVTSLINPPVKRSLVRFSTLLTCGLFFSMVVIRQIWLEIFASFYMEEYFKANNLRNILFMLVVSILFFGIIMLFLLIKHGYFKKGRGMNHGDLQQY